jgi:hypothetical protein
MSKSEKSAYFRHDFANTFCVCFFQNFFKGLDCKRPIQCLASAEILTPPPPPPHRPASVYPLAFGAGGGHGEDTLAGWRGGWEVNSS